MSGTDIFVSELSTSQHSFLDYHFCRGNSNKRKSRLGVIMAGEGTYMYLGKTLRVSEGDVVFIPENIYLNSEWHGAPHIEVVYVSCFIHFDGMGYAPQIVGCDEATKKLILHISHLLMGGLAERLEGYSLFYQVLKNILPIMQPASITYDKSLQEAILYISDHWHEILSVGEIAAHAHVSESKLYHLFQKELGQTPIYFLHSIQMNIAISYLENSQYSIAEISRMAGFASENHFRKVFYSFTGTTPLKYRKRK